MIEPSGPIWFVADNRLCRDLTVDCRYHDAFFLVLCGTVGFHDSPEDLPPIGA